MENERAIKGVSLSRGGTAMRSRLFLVKTALAVEAAFPLVTALLLGLAVALDMA